VERTEINLHATERDLTPSFLPMTHQSDPETGLYYYRARYYDTSAGRFLSEDLIQFGDGPNFYAYVTNSSPNFGDPTGLQHQTRPANPKYNCMAWGLGIDWKWIQPSGNLSPNVSPLTLAARSSTAARTLTVRNGQR